MKSFLTSLLAIAVLASCSNKEKKAEDVPTTIQSADTPPAAVLTDAQKAEGWQLLFDGVSTAGWQIFKGQENNTWEVVDGTLHCKALQEGVVGVGDKRSDIMTTEEFDNFELAFDWKIASQSNSGVMYRVTEEFEQPYFTGPEYQLVDDNNYPGGQLTDLQKTGACYDMYAASNPVVSPVGEWNTSRIVAKGAHIEHWLNGAKVVEYEIGSPDWNKRRDASKWKDVKGYGVPKKGHIDFQDHGHEVWFRNIMIRTL